MDHFDIPAKNYTYMGQYSTLKGEITLEGTTRLASVLEGKVIVAGDYNLVIEREGHIKGDIKCYNLEVHGQISGTIVSSGSVTLYPNSRVDGIINTKTLIIRPGAILNIEGHTKD